MNIKPVIAKLEPNKWLAVPTATYKWGAFGIVAMHTPQACERWFKTQKAAIAYCRGSIWVSYAIARARI